MDIQTLYPDIDGKPYLEFDFGKPWTGAQPRAVLSTLLSGDMKLDPSRRNASRERLFSILGIEPNRVLSLRLAHTRRVVVLGRNEDFTVLDERAATLGGVDGAVTTEGFSVLALTVADCMPIWLFDVKSKAFGLLHSGWRGTGILKEAVLGMNAEFGSRPQDISVIMGPSIGVCCYGVPEERAMAFGAEFGEDAISLVHSEVNGDQYFIDLRTANLKLASSLGIGRLFDVRLCTSCSLSLGSYRRQGASAFTRMIALCGKF